MSIYKTLSDPIWSSVGVVLSGIGVFVGAWFGGHKQLVELTDVYTISLLGEMEYNKSVINSMLYLLKKNPPIENALDALDIGAKSLKSEVWNQMLTNQTAFLLKKNRCQKYKQTVKILENFL
ncbi:hypothetical protein K0T92_10960 [Paenibacillus oenotherae]|uniref:Uncharacterized protein n=1 Tax=Paenibacillus oenotherae TaxID=1435645 RepID=A0ABS7D5P9_9BACL|nr:hypothetical protein [Paenibacillus oenotherae]MBW7475267.1 hypothetical protein [Paenibacillus oenotherae]